MGWFKRIKGGITTATHEKKETPDGLWIKCPKCKTIVTTDEHRRNLHICITCNYHSRIGSTEYFRILFDNNKFTELDKNISSLDPLKFSDKKTYPERLKSMQESTGLKDAVRTAYGKLENEPVVIACMDFSFIGGSMGSVVGEKIARAIDYARKKKCPILIISKSGGARMMEAGISLMQLAKTSTRLAKFSNDGGLFIPILTDPTTGGVTASYGMLGDVILAEPGALIGFAGPRVIKQTIGQDLPKGFQRSEFLLEKGFIDCIVDRSSMKQKLSTLISILK